MSTKQETTDQKLEWLAHQLETYAGKYREMAKKLRASDLNTVDMTGWKTIQDKVLFHLSGHSARASVTVDRLIDAKEAGKFLQEEAIEKTKAARRSRKKQ